MFRAKFFNIFKTYSNCDYFFKLNYEAIWAVYRGNLTHCVHKTWSRIPDESDEPSPHYKGSAETLKRENISMLRPQDLKNLCGVGEKKVVKKKVFVFGH